MANTIVDQLLNQVQAQAPQVEAQQPNLPSTLEPPQARPLPPATDPEAVTRQPSFLRKLLNNFIGTLAEDLSSGDFGQAVGAGIAAGSRRGANKGTAFGTTLGSLSELRNERKRRKLEEEKQRKQLEQFEPTTIVGPDGQVISVPKKDAARVQTEVAKIKARRTEQEDKQKHQLEMQAKTQALQEKLATEKSRLEERRLSQLRDRDAWQRATAEERTRIMARSESSLAQARREQVRHNLAVEEIQRDLQDLRRQERTATNILAISRMEIQLEEAKAIAGQNDEGILNLEAQLQGMKRELRQPPAAPPAAPPNTTNTPKPPRASGVKPPQLTPRPLTEDEARDYLQKAGGDKDRARAMARADGRLF